MLKPKQNTFNAKIQKNIDKGTVIIDAGSIVFDNQWISYQGMIFKVNEYIENVLDNTNRQRFFTNKNYAAQIIIGIDKSGSIKYKEGTQVLYSSKKSVPIPPTFETVPLVSILLIQDGSSDMNYGYKPLNETNVTFFSGSGNVLDKNQKGDNSNIRGITGIDGDKGSTGLKGLDGDRGDQGLQGIIGAQGMAPTGISGVQGMTGINWAIHIPFEQFF